MWIAPGGKGQLGGEGAGSRKLVLARRQMGRSQRGAAGKLGCGGVRAMYARAPLFFHTKHFTVPLYDFGCILNLGVCAYVYM